MSKPMTKPTHLDITDPHDFASRVVLRMGKAQGRRMLKEASHEGSGAQGRTVGVLYEHHISIFEGVKSSELAAFMDWAAALWSARFEAEAKTIKACWFDGLMVRLDDTY